jgi:DNA primase
VALPKVEPEAREQEERRKGLHEVMELACAFFESALQGRFGAKARDYLAGRGLDGETRRTFRIGYAAPGPLLASATTWRARTCPPSS